MNLWSFDYQAKFVVYTITIVQVNMYVLLDLNSRTMSIAVYLKTWPKNLLAYLTFVKKKTKMCGRASNSLARLVKKTNMC